MISEIMTNYVISQLHHFVGFTNITTISSINLFPFEMYPTNAQLPLYHLLRVDLSPQAQIMTSDLTCKMPLGHF